MKWFGVCVVLLAAQLSQVSLFDGDWRTDVPDIKWSSIPMVESGIRFAVTTDQVKVASRYVRPDGSSYAFENVLQTDGEPHPVQKMANWTVVPTWKSLRLLDLMFTGQGVLMVTTRVTYSLSADTKTLTRRGVYSHNGHIEKRVFYR